MRQTLQVRLSTQLRLTPQLQQSIRLLQLSALEINQELERLLTENPLLERDGPSGESVPEPQTVASNDEQNRSADENAAEAPSHDDRDVDWAADGYASGPRRDDDEEGDDFRVPAGTLTLSEHLTQQLEMMRSSVRDKNLISMLITALDENGYLTQSLEEIAELMPPVLEIELDELRVALKLLQSFDPIGVGALTPAECMQLQLNALPSETPARELALVIADKHLDALAARDYVYLKRALHCNDERLREAQALIRSLSPHPGAAFSTNATRFVVPDVNVVKTKRGWTVSLNADAMPRLRINSMYATILQNKQYASSAMNAQLQEARWLIKNLKQRFDTILRVAQAIVDRQRNFFEHGEVAMRPLVLREIATSLDLHESTVSRVTSNKYMATPRGILELKYFFGSHVSTDSGGACSATAIRALMKQLVNAEDRKRPLSDGKLAQILREQGIVVARRTVAKYRESLQLPPVSLRRML